MVDQMLDNAGSGEPGPIGAPAPITCLAADHPAHTPQARNVIVERSLGRILITREDGSYEDYDEGELLAACGVNVATGRLRAA